MAVAKTYEAWEQVGEPFDVDGKKWIKVIGPCRRCGGSGHYSMNAIGDSTCYRCNGRGKEAMEVRWYTDAQRASMDKAAEKRKQTAAREVEKRRIKFAARNQFGFGEQGFITIIVGNYEEVDEWRHTLPRYTVTYNTFFGWFMGSDKNVNIPTNFKTYRLNWKDVRDESDEEDLTMKSNEFVKQFVHEMIYGKSTSEYQGQKDEWLERNVTITSNREVSSDYGDSHMHTMEDENGNIYIWFTKSKNITEGTKLHMRMKVKEHKEYLGVKQTIVYYCKEK